MLNEQDLKIELEWLTIPDSPIYSVDKEGRKLRDDYKVYLLYLREYANSFARVKKVTPYYYALKEWHNEMRSKGLIQGRNSSFNRLLFEQINLIKYPEILFRILSLGIKKCITKAKESDFYRWYVYRHIVDWRKKDELHKVYKDKTFMPNARRKCVISIYDDVYNQGGGLADRLRSILSVYYACKVDNVDFKLYFNSPFPLKDFLIPAKYDWIISKEEISYNTTQTRVVSLNAVGDSEYMYKKQLRYLLRKLKCSDKQIHVYTAATLSYKKECKFHELFGELFVPSERLGKAIEKQLDCLGHNYVSVSCRFLRLLGDFNETYDGVKMLDDDAKEKLVHKVIYEVEKIHAENVGKKVLVNSDSITFLEKAATLPYVYVVPGNVLHICGDNGQYSYEKYEKTFLDFFMIANAERIYLIRSGDMHMSGYPYAASKIYNKPYEIRQI